MPVLVVLYRSRPARRGPLTAGAEASWEGSPGDGSTSDSAALSPEALEEAALSLSSSRRAATERLQAMDEFEAAHGGEPIDQSEA